jgi:NAD(P)-dependent dehydrogenase (short-subunit alcohol dehydrogenase family)
MRILMTGGTSGIGLEAVKRLLQRNDCELVIAARAPDQVPSLLKKRTRIVPLDLQSLDAARAFVAAVERETFDVLLLNAGIQAARPEKSKDGFELTFAVNHLAHYFIARALAPRLAQGGRVILTASGTHDPDLKTGIPAPHHADAKRLAYPDTDPERDKSAMTAGRRAYSASKLCNVMTARELPKRLARPDLAVAAYDPGFTPGTGLARSYPGPVGFIFRHLLRYFVRKTDRVSTPENSGALLADLAVSPVYAYARGNYLAVRGKALLDTPPSTLARNDAACAKLWDDSAALVGMKP